MALSSSTKAKRAQEKVRKALTKQRAKEEIVKIKEGIKLEKARVAAEKKEAKKVEKESRKVPKAPKGRGRSSFAGGGSSRLKSGHVPQYYSGQQPMNFLPAIAELKESINNINKRHEDLDKVKRATEEQEKINLAYRQGAEELARHYGLAQQPRNVIDSLRQQNSSFSNSTQPQITQRPRTNFIGGPQIGNMNISGEFSPNTYSAPPTHPLIRLPHDVKTPVIPVVPVPVPVVARTAKITVVEENEEEEGNESFYSNSSEGGEEGGDESFYSEGDEGDEEEDEEDEDEEGDGEDEEEEEDDDYQAPKPPKPPKVPKTPKAPTINDVEKLTNEVNNYLMHAKYRQKADTEEGRKIQDAELKAIKRGLDAETKNLGGRKLTLAEKQDIGMKKLTLYRNGRAAAAKKVKKEVMPDLVALTEEEMAEIREREEREAEEEKEEREERERVVLKRADDAKKLKDDKALAKMRKAEVAIAEKAAEKAKLDKLKKKLADAKAKNR